MSEAANRTPLTDTQMQIMDEVVRCSPHGWHPQPSALGAAEELRERCLLTRRMVEVDGPQAIYHATPEFKEAARLNAALGPMVDPGSQN
jgi:hypothetical protein